jgi:hypothetical protein
LDFDPKEAEMKYCGIDLHSNNSVVMVSDEKDRIVLQKRLPNELGQIQAALEPHRDELVGGMPVVTRLRFRGSSNMRGL